MAKFHPAQKIYFEKYVLIPHFKNRI